MAAPINIAELEIGDRRIEFVAEYVLKTMKLKSDKWTKMYGTDECKQQLLDFFEKNDITSLIMILNPSGSLQPVFEWPAQLKGGKACYFVKKNREVIGKDANLKNALLFGDMSYSPVDQFSTFVDEVFDKKCFLYYCVSA
jgi:dynein heavy chain